MPQARRAAFLDRDGTILIEVDHLADPEDVQLVPGAASALADIERAGYALVIVTNQSGIARGLFTEQQFEAVQRRMTDLLAAEGVSVAGTYHCPHHPEFSGTCACRKPAVGLHLRAARELGLDLRNSLYVGDRLRDVQPARVLGGVGVLVRTGYGAGEAQRAPGSVHVVEDLAELAARLPELAARAEE
jgi:D-glycero-D-manno-heptose 1,7-bisphosphate phosphatase